MYVEKYRFKDAMVYICLLLYLFLICLQRWKTHLWFQIYSDLYFKAILKKIYNLFFKF